MRSITPKAALPNSATIPPILGLDGARPPMSLRKPESAISPLTFTQLPGSAVSIAASPDGTFWVLSTQGLPNGDKFIYHYVDGAFVNVPGAGSRIAVGPDNTPWVVNAAGGIYHLVNGVFIGIAGGASEISVGGTVAAPLVDVISNQTPGPYGAGIYQYNVNAGTWSQLPGAGATVAASIDSGTYSALDITPGGFYVTNEVGGIYYFNLATGFEQLPGGAIQLAPTASGGLFALGDPTNPVQHGIYYNDLTTGTWTQMPGAAVSISANSKDLYAIGAAGGIYQSPILPPGPTPAPTLTFRGVNMAGFDFGSGPLSSFYPGNEPTLNDGSTFAVIGMNTVRIPIAWFWLQSPLGTALNSNVVADLQSVVSQYLTNGWNVILDLHSYMWYAPQGPAESEPPGGSIVTAQQLSDIWNRLTTCSTSSTFCTLAKTYPSSGHTNQLIFDLMNEPSNITTSMALANENAAIATIRANGLSNLVLVEGNYYSGLHSWISANYSPDATSNSAAFVPANIIDSANNFAINVHQYFDSDFSGKSATCITAVSQADLLNQISFNSFRAWIQANRVKAIVTELGSGSNAQCQSDISWFLSALQTNAYTTASGSGFLGWTAWAGGHAWGTTYPLGLNPGDLAAPMVDSTYANFSAGP